MVRIVKKLKNLIMVSKTFICLFCSIKKNYSIIENKPKRNPIKSIQFLRRLLFVSLYFPLIIMLLNSPFFLNLSTNERSALSSFRKEFFIPFRNASKATVGRTLCGSNDGFPTSGYYSGFGTKLNPVFGFAKSSQIQN